MLWVVSFYIFIYARFFSGTLANKGGVWGKAILIFEKSLLRPYGDSSQSKRSKNGKTLQSRLLEASVKAMSNPISATTALL